MLEDKLSTLPNTIRIDDYRDYMPYKVCTGGSYLSFIVLEKENSKHRYKKIYGTTSPNRFNRATGKFRDNSIDDTLESSYEYLTYDEMQAFVNSYVIKKSKDIKLFFDGKEIEYV